MIFLYAKSDIRTALLQCAKTGIIMPPNKPAIGSLFPQPDNIRRPSVDTQNVAMKYTQWKRDELTHLP